LAYPSANSGTPALATSVQTALEKEVQFQYRLAQAFREINMPSQSMVLPLQSDTSKAVFHSGGESERFVGGTANSGAGTGVTNDGGTAGTFDVSQIVLTAHRLISTTFLDNHIDEEILVNLLPMMTENVARAHAKAVDDMVLNGAAGPGINGIADMATNVTLSTANQVSLSNNDALTAAALLEARSAMGKYGLSPTDVTFIVSQKRYYDLIADAGFADITDVGSDVATKLVGSIGSVYGTPVLISDNFATTETTSTDIAYAVNTSNFVIPRLRGVNVEQDYEVREQRRLVVASQSLGFDRLFGATSNNVAAFAIKPVT
jgi:hypothetical protein